MLLGTGNLLDPRIYEVFDPPWWRIDRWAAYLWAKGLSPIMGHAVGYVVLDGRRVRVRQWVKSASPR